jgi:hypothetical protein
MSDTIVRPTFYEGEILPAADLVATVDSPRAQLARHERYLHRWGIATGLELKSADLPGGNGKSIVLTQGVAKDGSGREIIVPVDVSLNPADFSSSVSGKKDIWYPVFLSGRDERAMGTSMLTGACSSSLPTQIKENYDISYGSPGSEQALDEQTLPVITDGPADGVTSNPWLVLLGFVQWNPNPPGTFANAQPSVEGNPVVRRYVGVNAAEVVSGSGALQLATHPVGTPTSAIMALEIHEANDGECVFGKQGPDGSVVPVLTVSAKGDLTISGKLSSAVKPGTIQVQSGTASDGIVLPLPPGITSATQADLHIHVTLHATTYPPPTAGAGDTWIMTPAECSVDDSRRVTCRISWTQVAPAPTSSNPAKVVEAAGFCDYTIIAAVAAAGA